MATVFGVPTLPSSVPSLEDVLGSAPAPVLEAMEAAGEDVPSTAAPVPIDIQAVGMRRRDVVIAVSDPLGSGRDVSAVCTVDLSARVPATHRGLHLSRFGDVVARSTQVSHADVVAYARAVAEAIARSQYGDATVTVWARVPYVENLTQACHARSKYSLEHLQTMARARVSSRGTAVDIGVRVPHLVACPCVQKTYAHALRLQQPSQENEADVTGPLMTHSQRCSTTVIVRGFRGTWRIAQAVAALDGVLVRTRNTLPRDLELATVYRAHHRPQFIEDAVRSAVTAVARDVSAHGRFRSIAARSRSLESIHDFDLTASVVLSAAECAALGTERAED
jgi:GTP cyclohydrolase FolE2